MDKNTRNQQVPLAAAAVALMGLLAPGIYAGHQVTLPEGSVVELRMENGLNSRTAREGQTFRATVRRSMSVDGEIAIPADSTVEGRVTLVEPAERFSRAGVIGVEFYRLRLPKQQSYEIDGILTSLRADERKQIINEEGELKGTPGTKRNIVFIGGGAGAGAVIGALSGGAKGARIGAVAGGALGTLGAALQSGEEAVVPAGAEIAMQLVRPVTFSADYPEGQHQSGSTDRDVYTTESMVRGAQSALRTRKYYSGPIDGRLGEGTRRAIAHYQIDQNQPPTGDLDRATAASLGLVRVGSSSTREGDLQLATNLRRDARSLVDDFGSSLGVRAGPVRDGLDTRRNLSEAELELLLDLDEFATAASWYAQAVRDTPPSDLVDRTANILQRSAKRVELSMQAAQADEQMEQMWTDIQAELRRIENGTGHGKSRANGDDALDRFGGGSFRWSGRVDGSHKIRLQGANVRVVTGAYGSVREPDYDLSEPLPSRPVRIELSKQRGRGEIRLLQQPSESNGYTAVIQIDDEANPGHGLYEFMLRW